MKPFFDKHIFVCENVRPEGARVSCGKSDSKKIRELLKQKIAEAKIDKKIRVNMSGCLDQCELGPVQVSYPEGVWFSLKTPEDVENFVEHYIKQDSIEKIQGLLIEK
ncbi:MAG: (2Fe-2S) ferredoxin domain-containing protein [Leptospiraceae bacterium]|nr:(2Fe-2S) ferredoxin domain-containing protein [Leptospiraceae bacterium]